jgi:hypothetical protein
MNEMDVLTRFRAEVPCGAVSPEAERRFHAALSSAERVRPIPRRPALTRRGWGLAAAGVTVAAAVAAGFVAAAPAPVAHPSAHPRPAAVTVTVQELAYRAASAALAGPAVRPGQWIYRKSVRAGRTFASQTEENWQTADSSQSAWYTDGKLVRVSDPVTVPVSYARLRTLSANPAALDKYLVSLAAKYVTGSANRVSLAAPWIGSLYVAFVPPPRLSAELFHALADLPGGHGRP